MSGHVPSVGACKSLVLPCRSLAACAIDQVVNTYYPVLDRRSITRRAWACRDRRPAEAERREQILNAAYNVALRRGIEGLTVRAVAAGAGLSHGLVLFHFKRKGQLVSAVLDRVLANTLSLPVGQEVDGVEHPRERLRGAASARGGPPDAQHARIPPVSGILGARQSPAADPREDRRGARALSGGVPAADGGDPAGRAGPARGGDARRADGGRRERHQRIAQFRR